MPGEFITCFDIATSAGTPKMRRYGIGMDGHMDDSPSFFVRQNCECKAAAMTRDPIAKLVSGRVG